ncbi:hypothetical protein KUTeg_007444 [Tegillarca granosa]|uniref:Fibrinogen C-terminal domain-containing protein n=1 Tax=Tegillarca granosa TaxID=220873 RepID=A0ABQ9FDA5_TEGGR|nr:hypothetical protein KUTeg_007444 [Tegillarca granosa]
MDGSTNFYRNWNTYVSGFGNISHEYWLGDALAFTKGCSFSTYDNDINSCSVRYGGGWWYSLCHNANLNGFYGDVSFGRGLTWHQWHEQNYSLKTTEMKIRRI